MSDHPPLDRLRELRRTQDEELAAQDLEGARQRFLEVAAGGSSRPGAARLGPARARWIAPAALVALAGACAALLLVLLPSSRSLSFAVGSAQGQVGAWIAAGADAPLAVAFSDGTSLALDANARARVVAADARGARVLLEGGRLTATVTHTATSAWNFDVGPFDVLVTGTRFELSWSPVSEELKLVLREGSVAVSGPLVGGRRTVAAGETLDVFCKEQRFELTRGELPAAAPPAPSPTRIDQAASEPAPAPTAASERAKVAKAADASPRPPSWRDLVAGDRYRGGHDGGRGRGLRRARRPRERGGSADARGRRALLREAGSRRGGAHSGAEPVRGLGRGGEGRLSTSAGWRSTSGDRTPRPSAGSSCTSRSNRAAPLRRRRSGGSSSAGSRWARPARPARAARRYLARYPAGPHAAHAGISSRGSECRLEGRLARRTAEPGRSGSASSSPPEARAAPPEPPPEPPRPKVVLIADRRSAPIMARVYAELATLGFTVEVVRVRGADAPSHGPSRTSAREAGAAVALRVAEVPGGVEVSIDQGATGKSVQRTVMADDPATVAIRAVELLRASLLEVRSPPPSRGEVEADPAAPAVVDAREPPPARPAPVAAPLPRAGGASQARPPPPSRPGATARVPTTFGVEGGAGGPVEPRRRARRPDAGRVGARDDPASTGALHLRPDPARHREPRGAKRARGACGWPSPPWGCACRSAPPTPRGCLRSARGSPPPGCTSRAKAARPGTPAGRRTPTRPPRTCARGSRSAPTLHLRIGEHLLARDRGAAHRDRRRRPRDRHVGSPVPWRISRGGARAAMSRNGQLP